MAKIAAISGHDIHKITSSQVIIDLTTCVKELVDNSIDAHAHHIEVTFKDYGLESIECSDDGDGISSENFESLALKHFTSKIKSFSDLSSVESLGFRGEALASLCAVAHVCVTTTSRPPRADKLEYDISGTLISKSTTSRNKGTTVLVSDLFYNLPVRKKEFGKSCKRQFTQCIALLQNYALIQEDVKMSVWNVSSNKKKRLVLSTSRCQEMPKRILSIFGSSSMRGLSPVDLELDLNPYKALINKRHTDGPEYDALDYRIRVQGYISKSSFGCGRSAKDRQSVFINRRPIEYPALLRCCNEVYRTYNNVQYPTVFLNFVLSPILIDVNVTPDKRTVMLHNERYIIEVFRENLTDYYDKQEQVLPKALTTQNEEPEQKKRRVASQILEDGFCEDDESDQDADEPGKPYTTEKANDLGALGNSRLFINTRQDNEAEHIGQTEELSTANSKSFQGPNKTTEACLELFSDKNSVLQSTQEVSERPTSDSSKPSFDYNKSAFEERLLPKLKKASLLDESKPKAVEVELRNPTDQEPDEKDEQLAFLSDECCVNVGAHTNDGSCDGDDEADIHQHQIDAQEVDVHLQQTPTKNQDTSHSEPRSLANLSPIQNLESERLVIRSKIELPARPSSRLLELQSKKPKANHQITIERNKDLQDLEEGEKYMTLTVKKDDFRRMQVVGQFNLGFIIVTRHVKDKYDLFIVDQHASDEKFNFEMLQKSTVFKSQSLIAPLPVELSVIDELLVMENMDIFEKNGFKINIDDDEEQGSKIKLMSLPVSKKTLFTVDDFHELVYLIKKNDGIQKDNIRCSKVRSMFAMRACRSSIMIGKPLAMKTMTKVVRHLSELDKPWNCPHGRPTMRHLMELKDWDPLLDDYKL